ncbi:MAG TPA: response regulator [Verrucomicrobiae bacterium]|jgi:two-component system response regulator|nr:response regulator [Verrucomicrobiae bacterium]
MKAEGAEILLVEDNASDLELTLHALKHNSLIQFVHVARDGEEALNFLFCREKFQGRAGRPFPQLILLDLKLPKVDGLGVLRTLKEDSRTRSIPIIVLSSSGEDRDLLATYELGVNSYIQKPVDFDRFRETVETLGRYWLRVNHAPPRQHLKSRAEK